MTRRIVSLVLVVTVLVIGLSLGGCASAGIAIREKLGYAKREQLVDRVEETKQAQEAAKEQFSSALEEFMAVTNADGGDLEKTYKQLKKEYERSQARADKVHSKIKSVETVANALFREWESELGQYSNAQLRASSQAQLEETRQQYQQLIMTMKQAESKMDPVLAAFGDQVLFLKHNLNARAIASLKGTAADLQNEISSLIADMEASIDQANAFIDSMGL